MKSSIRIRKEKLVSLSTGAGAAGLTIGSSVIGPAAQLCNGICGSCGLGCSSLIAVATVGMLSMIRQKYKNKTQDQTD
ncbi:hypothetical protein [Brevibacillus sp. SYSU BS000544]|uniref:hypothetical protein n=1 Tax=Brevibacillus sp. SYSU BS000544 TaxID=3416443 RepID=UPI003CE55C6A